MDQVFTERQVCDRSASYLADAKSVWSWRKNVESCAEFYIDSREGVRVGNDASE